MGPPNDLIVSDTTPAEQTREIAYTSAIRGKFLELMALYAGRQDIADKLYLLGLFSLLDKILERNFEDIFRELSLDEEIEAALLDRPEGFRTWLNLARLLEFGNWLKMDSCALELGLDLKSISKSKLEALEWANNFFKNIE